MGTLRSRYHKQRYHKGYFLKHDIYPSNDITFVCMSHLIVSGIVLGRVCPIYPIFPTSCPPLFSSFSFSFFLFFSLFLSFSFFPPFFLLFSPFFLLFSFLPITLIISSQQTKCSIQRQRLSFDVEVRIKWDSALVTQRLPFIDVRILNYIKA